ISTSVIIGNTPPLADNLTISPKEPTPDDDLLCSYQYNDIDNDTEGETQIRWYKDEQLQSKYNNSFTIPSVELGVGQIWYFTVQPNDGTQLGDIKRSNPIKISEKSQIPMINLHLPMVIDLKILPEEPYTNNSLQANYTYFDLDGDPESGTELKWYKNGVHQKELDNYRAIPAIGVSKGDRWYFTVRPNDGKDFGELNVSNEVIVKNSPPLIKDAIITPFMPKKTNNLVCNYVYTDLDNDIESGTEIRWFKDGQLQSLYNDQRIIPPNELSKGQRWYFTVKPKDGTDFGEMKISNEVTIVNSAPIALNLAISPKSPLTNDDVLCSYEYSDIDNDAEFGTEIRWFKDDQIVEKFNDQLKIPSSDTIKGQKWYFTIRPRDGYLYGDIQKSEIVIIGDSEPMITDLIITPSSPRKSDSLLCHYNYSDPDFDIEIGTEIKWIKNDELQAEYNNKTSIPSSAIKKGDRWQFRIRTRYEKGFTEWQASLPVIVQNTPPVAVIKSDTQVVAVGSPIKFIGSDSFDIDGDMLSYNWDADSNNGMSIDSTEKEFIYVYQKAGNYTVTLVVSDGEAYSTKEVFNVKVEDKSILVGASYNIPDEKFILKFNKPMKSDMLEIDGKKICIEISDSGKPDIQIQEKCKPIVNWTSASEVIIDISNDSSTAFAIVLEGVIRHHKLDLILPADLIMDIYGIGNKETLCSDDVTIEMISDRFKIGVIGDVNGSGTVSNYDAEMTLNAVVNGVDTLPIYNSAMEINRWLAKYEYSFNAIMDIADIDRDGLLSSYDASLMMQKAMKLVPENIPNNKQIYRKAVLKVNRYEHQNIDATVILNDVSDVYSIDLIISYDPQKLITKRVVKSNETSQWLMAYSDSESGKLKISMAGASQSNNGNAIVNIGFGSIIGDIDMPKIESIRINGQKFGTIIEDIPKQTLLLQNYPNP
ncbi:MAG: PKD domain-containing protein, partial [Candidatus Poribacteria bacterium]